FGFEAFTLFGEEVKIRLRIIMRMNIDRVHASGAEGLLGSRFVIGLILGKHIARRPCRHRRRGCEPSLQDFAARYVTRRKTCPATFFSWAHRLLLNCLA